jgi:ribosomal protein L28
MSKLKHAKTCALCDRGYNKANIRSHSNIATIKKQRLNLQDFKINGRTCKVCTRCLKAQVKKAAK